LIVIADIDHEYKIELRDYSAKIEKKYSSNMELIIFDA
jgi:hypothetical protein